MSAGASDVPTDEDFEVLPNNGFSYSGDYSKKTPKKKAGKPPPSLRSPYLSSMNVNSRKAAMSAWKLPRTSLCDTPGGETYSARFTSLSNHHDQRSEWDMTAEFPRHTLPTRKHHHSVPNVARDKEEMHNEITLLKKSLHEQKSDNQKMKVKLRRLEEDNAKREKQLEELLDPTNRSEYIRSLVDKKHEGSVVVNGLKQRILKLEQQCREKENAIGNLQSELRATNLQEMKMTVKNYFEEIQRLKLLLEASEKSGISESKVFRRQQKALSSTVLRLSEDLKQLQLDNAALREEMNTDSPVAGIKGYKEWSKYRLLRRLLEMEKRLEERNALKARNRLEPAPAPVVHREAQTVPPKLLDLAVQTPPADTADARTETAEEDDVANLRGRVERLEAERLRLREALTGQEEDAKQTRTRQQEEREDARRQHDDKVGELKTEKEELEKRLERWRAEQTSERELERRRHGEEVQQLTSQSEKEADRWRHRLEKERQQHEQELRRLRTLVQTLEEKNDRRDEDRVAEQCDEADDDDGGEEEKEGHEQPKADLETCTVERKTQSEAGDSTTSPDRGVLDETSLVSIQAAFRGHLARTHHLACREATSESEDPTTAAAAKTRLDEEAPRPVPTTHKSPTPSKDPDTGDDAYSEDSDDSDDIIVAESYPRRSREARIL
ncbi:IQ domain-containing protein E isoform X2 [Hippocampus comes]|uniref:IQ domain-containing protein E isoform X2 n=1 Tax=Hippocampus comes TaxID=109280 RepID=UPI00094F23FB|nr:PREDICTED: IQ domain-containing protein E isoform X2 [Hippocampus comes]